DVGSEIDRQFVGRLSRLRKRIRRHDPADSHFNLLEVWITNHHGFSAELAARVLISNRALRTKKLRTENQKLNYESASAAYRLFRLAIQALARRLLSDRHRG